MPASDTDKAKYIACAAIVPDCDFTASAATEDELLEKVVHLPEPLVLHRFGRERTR